VEDSARGDPGVKDGARGAGSVPPATGVAGGSEDPALNAAVVTATRVASSVRLSARHVRGPGWSGRGRLNR
jgi:hypothetical protein